ncbi:MAG: hypothetical protein HYV63_09945 [Candidatus Schekmanbacteria bacterium]|nr:hypothetical protein [Candidatus Schekmanbacteria bacterium]
MGKPDTAVIAATAGGSAGRPPRARLWPACVGEATGRRLRRLLLGALVIRVLLLPLFTHLDLLTEYWVAHIRAFDGRFPFEVMGGIFPFSLTHYWHVASLWLVSPLLPDPHELFRHPWGEADSPGMTTLEDWRFFLGHPAAMRAVALFKLPYIGLDLLGAALLTRLADTEEDAYALARFWLLNPVCVFVLYVFSRYEVVSVLAVLAALLAIKRGRQLSGMVWLGLGAILKMYPFLLAPCAVLGLQSRLRGRVRLGLALLVPGILLLASATVTGNRSELGSFSKFRHNDYLFELRLPTADPPSAAASVGVAGTQGAVGTIGVPHIPADVLLFPLALFLVWLRLAGRTLGRQAQPEADFELFLGYGLAVFLLLFATCFFHPHYAMWAVPFWAVMRLHHRRLRVLWAMHLPLLVVHSFHWGAPLWSQLAAVIDPISFWSSRAPVDVLGDGAAAFILSVNRALLSGICVFAAWCALRIAEGDGKAQRGELAGAG